MPRFVRAALLAAVLLFGLDARAQDDTGRVLVLGIDSLDPDVIALLVSEGKMPNFAKLRKEGAFGRLRSSEPILSPIIWTTIATGKPPTEHGIGDFAIVNEKTGERVPVTSQMRQVDAIWNILTAAGKSVGVVGWWATWPAEQVNGVLVSDHTCYHFLFSGGLAGGGEEESDIGIIHPPERQDEISVLVKRPGDVTRKDIESFVSVPEEDFDRPFEFHDDLSHFKWAWATAESYRRIGLELWEKDHPDLLMVYIEGVDSSSHLFGHLFRADGLGGELAIQQKQFGQTVEQMYLYADRLLGEYLAVLGENDTLVVLSDHGFDLGALHADPSKTRDMRRVSAKNHRIEGVIYLYGKHVKPGATIEGSTLVDVAPTILTLEGIAPAKDMPGRVLAEALTLPDPERTLATFEDDGTDVSAKSRDASVDPAILARLEALGYLEAESPRGTSNIAAMSFEEGNYEESVAAYRKQLEKNPKSAGAHASLGGALGAMGKYEEALKHLDEAIRLAPLHAGAHHNRAVVYERQGKTEAAIVEYKEAVRFGSGYAPSREALIRLTGSPVADTPTTEEQRLAKTLANQASVAARKGRYEDAMALLDRAERVAPEYGLVHQYRSNVAFLMGDRAGARAALERALEIEPENPLFRRNLAHLETALAEDGPASPSEEKAR